MEIKIAPHMINRSPRFPQKQNDDDMIFKAVKDVIDDLDPFDLLKSGAPKDEFDAESRMIASRIRASSTVKYIARVICEVLRSQFMPVYRPEDFLGEAQKIRSSIRADSQKTDKKYYSVEFTENGYPYSYDYDGNDISIGDKVLVPVSGGQKVAVVTDYDHLITDEISFPIEKIKKIIRKATPEDEI